MVSGRLIQLISVTLYVVIFFFLLLLCTYQSRLPNSSLHDLCKHLVKHITDISDGPRL